MKRGLLFIIAVICCYSLAVSQGVLPKNKKVSCYSRNREKGISLYNKGNCAEAKKYFTAANNCPDKPSANDISTWINKCNNCKKTTTTTTPPKKTYNGQDFAKQSYMTINNIKFGSTDAELNIETSFGNTLYSDIKYFTPKLYYDGLASTDKETVIYVSIYKPDGTLMTGSTSPTGYTYSADIEVESGSDNELTLPGWGNNVGTIYQSGTYEVRIYSSYGNLLFTKYAYIYPAKETTTTTTTANFELYGTTRYYSDNAVGISYLRDDVTENGGFRTGALTTNGAGVIIRGTNGYAFKGIATNLSDKIKSLNSNNSNIEDVFMSQNGEYYGIVFDSYGYLCHGPQTLSDKLKEYNTSQENISSVSVNNNGDFIIITDKHLYASNNSDYNDMIEAKNKFGFIYSACTTNEGVIFCCEKGIYYKNIPTNLETKLKSLSWKPKVVKFTDSGTFIITDGESTYSYQM